MALTKALELAGSVTSCSLCRRIATIEIMLEQWDGQLSKGENAGLGGHREMTGQLNRRLNAFGIERVARDRTPTIDASARGMPREQRSTLDDPRVFRDVIKDHATWGAWRGFLKALFGLPMEEAEAALLRDCTGRTSLPTAVFGAAWLVCGRRAGKSFALALIAVFLACFRDYRPHLAMGERAPWSSWRPTAGRPGSFSDTSAG